MGRAVSYTAMPCTMLEVHMDYIESDHTVVRRQ